MAVPVTVFSESNGPTPTVTDSITSLAFASIDNNSNVASLSVNNPVAAGTNSYEKWIRQKLTTPSTNSVSGFGVYFTAGSITDGGGATNTVSVYFKTNAAYATPSSATTAGTVLSSTQTAAPGTSFTAPANSANAYSGYITLQMTVAAGASGTNVTFPANFINVQYTYS